MMPWPGAGYLWEGGVGDPAMKTRATTTTMATCMPRESSMLIAARWRGGGLVSVVRNTKYCVSDSAKLDMFYFLCKELLL